MTIATSVAMKSWPAPIKRQIRETCGGDWDRVVVSNNGSITVYNNAALAARARAREDAPSPAAAAAPVPARPTARPTPRPAPPLPRAPEPERQPEPLPEPVDHHESEVDTEPVDELADYVPDVDDEPDPPKPRAPRKTMLEALAERQAQQQRAPKRPGLGADSQAALDRLKAHVKAQQEQPPAAPAPSPPVEVTSVPIEQRRPRKEVLRRDGDGSDFDPRVLIEAAQTNTGLVEFLGNGLPRGAAYLYFPDVVDLYGIDFDLVDAVIRNPQEVTLRPETSSKGYPVIKFNRGDIDAIVGFKDPHLPMCIAVYYLSRLDREGLRTGNHEHFRPPATGSALLRHLRGMGALVQSDVAKPTARIVYKEQDLGQVSTRDHDRDAIRRDFERMARKIRGVDAAEKEKQDADGPR